MREHLLDQLPMLIRVESLIKRHDPSAPFQTVSRHFQLVHGVHILHVHLHGRPIGSLGRPHVEVFVSPRFEVDGIVAVMEIRELGEEVEMVFGIELCVYSPSS